MHNAALTVSPSSHLMILLQLASASSKVPQGIQGAVGTMQSKSLSLYCQIDLRKACCCGSCPHLVSLFEALGDKRRQGVITVQVGLEPQRHTVEVWTTYFQVLTSRTGSHLFSHLLTIAWWQPALSCPARHKSESPALAKQLVKSRVSLHCNLLQLMTNATLLLTIQYTV